MILSDIMMPDIHGFEYVKTIRRLSNEIPILFMTVRDDFAAKLQGFHVGIDDSMVKSMDLQELGFVCRVIQNEQQHQNW